MAYVIAVLMAALSFLMNRAALRIIGVEAVITIGPILEEGAKTVLAFYLEADILLTHMIFGVIEAIYDWLTSGQSGVVAAAGSIVGHILFGGLTVAVLSLTGNLGLALLAGISAHLIWNITMVRLM